MAIKRQKIVIVGLGEVGKPLLDISSGHHDTIGVDIAPVDRIVGVDVLHICYPFQVNDFIGETVRYIEFFKPNLTIINSTVGIGTTRMIANRAGAKVVNSPVRGKHARMREEMGRYTKFIGAITPLEGRQAARHFQSLGMKTKVLPSPEATELAKLTETTFFGLMIAWAQEVERYCDQTGQSYDDIVSFYKEINFFPPVTYFPGTIGGHCVMPNIEILGNLGRSALLSAIKTSNEMKKQRETQTKRGKANTAVEHGGDEIGAVA